MNEEGWIPLSFISNFNRVKMLTRDHNLITQALANSDIVEVANNKIRKKGDWNLFILTPYKVVE